MHGTNISPVILSLKAVDEDGILNIDVADVMHTWVLQPGFPVVNLTRSYESTDELSFTAEQSRFLINQDDTDYNK